MNHCAWQHAIRNFSTLKMWVGLYVFQLIQYLVLSSNTSPLMNIIISGTKVHMRCVNNELMDWFAFGSVNQMPSSSLCQTKTGLRTSFSVLFYVLFFLNLFFWITNYKVYRKKFFLWYIMYPPLPKIILLEPNKIIINNKIFATIKLFL